MVELPRTQPHLIPHQLQMAPPTLNTAKNVPTVIILPSLANEPDTWLKGTERSRDQQKLPSLQSGPPELAVSPSTMNPTVSWTFMLTHVC